MKPFYLKLTQISAQLEDFVRKQETCNKAYSASQCQCKSLEIAVDGLQELINVCEMSKPLTEKCSSFFIATSKLLSNGRLKYFKEDFHDKCSYIWQKRQILWWWRSCLKIYV